MGRAPGWSNVQKNLMLKKEAGDDLRGARIFSQQERALNEKEGKNGKREEGGGDVLVIKSKCLKKLQE